MSISEKLTAVATNVPLVYKAGMDEFAKMITDNFTRTNYTRAFNSADLTGYTFKQTVKPSASWESIANMFYDYRGTELPGNVSFELVQPGSANTNLSVFSWAIYITSVYDLHILNNMISYGSWFSYCRRLKTIALLPCIESTVFPSTFLNCDALKDVTFSGVIGQSISFAQSVNLSLASMTNIISCLKDYSATATTKTLTLHDTAKAKLSTAQIAEITQKGWTLA